MSWLGKKPADQVTSGQQLADGTVSTSKLAALAVTTAKLADQAVTAAKMAAGAALANLGFTPAVGNGSAGANINLNTLIVSGMYRLENNLTNAPNGCTYGQLLVMRGSSDTITQIYCDFATGNLYTRSGNSPDVGGSGAWSAWQAATGLGTAGQVWSDVTASRANNTIYTNTTGRPIAINIAKSANGAGNLYVNGSNMGYYYANSNDFSLFAIVPAGATYQAAFSNIARWSELR